MKNQNELETTQEINSVEFIATTQLLIRQFGWAGEKWGLEATSVMALDAITKGSFKYRGVKYTAGKCLPQDYADAESIMAELGAADTFPAGQAHAVASAVNAWNSGEEIKPMVCEDEVESAEFIATTQLLIRQFGWAGEKWGLEATSVMVLDATTKGSFKYRGVKYSAGECLPQDYADAESIMVELVTTDTFPLSQAHAVASAVNAWNINKGR